MPNPLATNGYPTLLRRIKSEIDSGRTTIEHTRALAYWKVGEIIHKDILKHKARADYGEQLFTQLSNELDISVRTVQRAVQFHREFPIPSSATQLSWSHYTELLSISNKFQRRQLQQRALAQGLSKNELRREIALLRGTRDEGRETNSGQTTSVVPRLSSLGTPVLKPQKGLLYTYKVDAAQPGFAFIDLGFNITHRVAWKGKKLTAGSIIKSNRTSTLTAYSLRLTANTPAALYTYRASVISIIDADTMWVNIDLGFNTYVRQKVRLRGIDAPELAQNEGRRAKSFVEKALKGLEYILIRTSTSDKYDRYLADVFYGKEEAYLNQQLLDEGLAVSYKT